MIAPKNEANRIREVHKYDLEQTFHKDDLDFLSTMAAEICQTEAAIITLITRDTQYIKSANGVEFEERKLPREFVFCNLTLEQAPEITIVENAKQDERFKKNPFTENDNPVVFYAGVPLINQNGYAIGTICAIDSNPHSLTAQQIKKLKKLASQVVNLLELRRKSVELETANRDLQISKDRFDHITSGTATATFEWNLLSDQLIFNEQWQELTGYETSLKEKQQIYFWRDRVHPKDLEILLAKLNDHLEDKKRPFQFEFRVLHKNGHYIWIDCKGKVFVDDQGKLPVRMFGILEDVTEIKKKEHELLYNKKLLDALYELSPIGIALNDFEDGSFLAANEKLLQSSRYTREEFLKLSYWDVTPRAYENEEQFLIEKLTETGAYGPYEKEYINKNGETYPVLLNGILVEDIDGNKKIWSFIEDITERKNTENLRAENLKRIEKLYALTENQNDRLKNFAYIVSHNLRSHSGGISVLLDFLKDDCPEVEDGEAFMHLKNASRNLENTIEDLNEVVEINLSDVNKFHNISVNKVISATLESVKGLAAAKEVEIILDVEPNLSILGIKSYLESIVLNFITNGIKYRAIDRQSYIKLTAKREDAYTLLSFKDNGQGIDMRMHKDQLFKMYKTFHQHEDSRGIGLFITKNQIDTMNGFVKVESEVNNGTEFKVFLPYAKD
ncbi:PAS domain S-box-containing protein [Salegentibacter echinorum]|uniref:histidine kinase n=1 Tax=Salegentibacter echinorum TaxID=1073325 RepID=A0A1M5EB39_SALEC|nr:PAS domain S-box protein [Salegentibacter echinorum]SHF76449.1 PAS domain S-box-containing protein [Salegentibacter echinorum]